MHFMDAVKAEKPTDYRVALEQDPRERDQADVRAAERLAAVRALADRKAI
jgi:hypothetical protein